MFKLSFTKPVWFVLVFNLCITSAYAGDVDVFHPPFERDQRFLISQSFYGKYSHLSAINAYAIDVNMPQGASVCAARSGKVYQIRDKQQLSGQALFVRIRHVDGNIADYHHLQAGSFKVNLGQAIKQGECFAKVGDTGKATGVHLHFAILKENEKGRLVSVPFKLTGKDGAYWPEYLGWAHW